MPGELSDRRGFRAADAERDAVVDALHRHAEAGRLGNEELIERIGHALSAKTVGELEDLTADLPEFGATPKRQRVLARPLVLVAGKLAVIDAIVVAIWLMFGRSGGLWPAWIMVLSSLVFIYRALNEQLRSVLLREREAKRSA